MPLPARTEDVFGVPLIVMFDTRTMKPEAKGRHLSAGSPGSGSADDEIYHGLRFT